jgi:hypothetical protein
MTPMNRSALPIPRAAVIEPGPGRGRDWPERKAAYPAETGLERLSLAERFEQALLEAERLHGD